MKDAPALEASALLAGARVVASISGGKDSAAMALALREVGIPFESVFHDTGWEHPDTYAYLRDVLDPKIGPIRWLQSKHGGMVEHVHRKGMFPSRMRRWCTEELKAFPMRDHLRSVIAEEIASEAPRWIVNATGIRAEESRSRGALPEWEQWGADGRGDLAVFNWRPILRWSEADVVAIHKRHGLRPNPLYLRGASRVGCWPCIHARKAEIALVAREDPARIDLIRALEAEQTAKARARAAARAAGPWPWSLTYRHGADGCISASPDLEMWQRERELRDLAHWRQTRTYFGVGDKFREEVPWIDTVVDWAQTTRGGRQYSLLPEDGARDGCMRWGMCETGGPTDEE